MTEKTQYATRLNRLTQKLKANSFEGAILAPGPNLQYYTGVKSLLLERLFLCFVPIADELCLVAPALESGAYLRSPVKIRVASWTDSEGPGKALQETLSRLRPKGKWSIEGDAPFRFLDALTKYAPIQVENADPLLQGIRAVKDPGELLGLRRAAAILSKSFLKLPDLIEAGTTEIELANGIKSIIFENGAESVEDVLVQTGPMSADPHHLPSSKKIRRKESIVIDATCTYESYFADVTRTFMLGLKSDFRDLYDNVLAAQEAATQVCKQNVTVGSVDEAARSHLRRNGLDSHFIHRTGHGLGLEVHEAPYIVPNGTEVLRPSMVFTVEPGVYFEGKAGVRIEDDVAITTSGRKVLTETLPKEFGWWS